MNIDRAEFDSEKELQNWVEQNLGDFIPQAIFAKGFQIHTGSGKGGVPDGFAFDFQNKSWYVLECELLTHGVWPHIAEQITRFVVALQNSDSRRRIRDKLFELVVETNRVSAICKMLQVPVERLMQKIEVFIEGNSPRLLIFIDDTNQDLTDMVHALDIDVSVFVVKKFLFDGKPAYHAPDRNRPVVVTESEPSGAAAESEYDVLEQLGGGTLESTSGRYKCFRLNDNRVVHIMRSKFHESNGYYWFGVSTQKRALMQVDNVTHVVFVLGESGFVVLPIAVLNRYLDQSNPPVSTNPDGSVRHTHCLISPLPEPELYYSSERLRIPLTEYYHAWE